MFDSPLEWCPVCRSWISIDQSVAECARQQGCVPGLCPLAALLETSEKARKGLRGSAHPGEDAGTR